MKFIDSITGDQWLSIGALVLSIIAIVVTSINIYLQYYKIELVSYAKEKGGNLFLVIENNSSNMAKDYSIKMIEVYAPLEIKNRLAQMPLLTGEAKFNLSPKDTIEILIGTHIEAMIEEDGNFPRITVNFYDSKNKNKGYYRVDFNFLINKYIANDDSYNLQKEIRQGFRSVTSALKKK